MPESPSLIEEKSHTTEPLVNEINLNDFSSRRTTGAWRRQPVGDRRSHCARLVTVAGESRFQHADAGGRIPRSLEDDILG
jgi:hypothetical protein